MGTSAFASAGYGSSWGPGSCSPPPPPPPSLPSRYKFTNKEDLKTAVKESIKNATSAVATYGLIADWDVSCISDMSYLFYEPPSYSYSYELSIPSYSYSNEAESNKAALDTFDANISNWNTSGVTDMSGMFKVRAGLHLEAPRPPPGVPRGPCLRFLTPR